MYSSCDMANWTDHGSPVRFSTFAWAGNIFRGTIMDKNAVVKTIHQAIIEFNGKSYLFYHNDKLPGGGQFQCCLQGILSAA
ncbi:hypothetical protein ACQ4WP_00730 [Janthinobacterium sp. GB4P2]|uniref:hypothetical protein n=1 Tax=Janthinobacterium sp. GB4P2 TaxID=3424189 RepID=UPI003F22B468